MQYVDLCTNAELAVGLHDLDTDRLEPGNLELTDTSLRGAHIASTVNQLIMKIPRRKMKYMIHIFMITFNVVFYRSYEVM